MQLMKTQKNKVLEIIKHIELDPFNFRWDTVKFRGSTVSQSYTVDKIVYIGSDFYFTFGLHEETHFSIFSPGTDILIERADHLEWDEQCHWVINWLKNLKREIDAPDLWQELSRYKLSKSDRISDENTNAPFTANQAEEIIDGINKLRSHIGEQYSLNAYEKKLVNDKLDYLIDAAKRQGRMDWIHTAIGVIFTLATSLNMSPDQAKVVWSFIKNAVSGVIQFLSG